MHIDADIIRQGLEAGAIVAGFIFLAWVTFHILRRIEKTLVSGTSNVVDERVLHAVTGPMVVLVFLQGPFLAALLFDALASYRMEVHSVWGATVVGLLAIAMANAFNAFLGWYGQGTGPTKNDALERQLAGPLRRAVIITIYALAAVVILDQMGISISPILAGLGIGGLAVALALQPTLSNFFAGTYLVSDRVAKPGDFIELESGLRGYVIDVGWRSTRVRTPYNNIVVIPNSRLADSIVVNYTNPTMGMGVLVSGGVSYSSDLAQVRAVCIEVAQKVIDRLDEADKDFAPWFGYDEFGESNITFWVWVQSKDRIGSFALKSSIIEDLHRTFQEKGIEINYPVRQLVIPPVPETPRLGASIDLGRQTFPTQAHHNTQG